MPETGGLRCGGLTPISTGMSYNPVDAFNQVAGTATSLGLGWTLDHDIAFLPLAGPQKRLILPGNTPVNFTDDGSGVYRPFDDPRFDGAEFRAINLATNDWELKFRDGRAWRFKQFGLPSYVTEMIDAQGNSLPIQRNPSGRITSVGTGERGVAMSYGPNGFVSEIADTAGRTMQYTYTPSNRLSTVTDADGRVTTYAYVNDGEFPPNFACGFLPSGGERLKTITYPGRPNPTENFYGPGRRVLRQVGYAHSNFLQLAESMSFGLDRPTLRDLWIAGWKSETEKLVRGEVLRDDFKETRIRSGRYNVFPSRDGYSFLTVHALDASDLFGTTGTVIVLYRFDTAKEWWMSNPHDPFSFGYRRRVERVVSEDEFALLPVLAEKLGTPYRVFALGSNPVTSYDAEWREGRTWLEARR